MKKTISLCLLMGTIHAFAQNGITYYPAPAGYTNSELTQKNCIAADNAGNAWVGFRHIGAGRFDGFGWTMFDTINSPLPNKYVQCITPENSGAVWFGTALGGAARMAGINWTIYNTLNSGLPSNTVKAIVVAGSETWFGTTAGLAMFDGTNWTVYNTSNSGLVSDTVNCIAVDAGGVVWAGTRRGLSKKSGSSWTNYTLQNTPAFTGYSHDVDAIYIDAANELWLSTGSGVNGNVFREAGGAIFPVEAFYSTPAIDYTAASSFFRGPNGGTAFVLIGRIVEIHNGVPRAYYPETWASTSSTPVKAAHDPSGNTIWLIRTIGLQTFNNGIAAFDASQHNGLGLGHTFYNLRELDANNVRAAVMNRGDMHWDLNDAKYEVPKGSGVKAIFNSALWIGGLDQGGNLHQAAMTYRQTGTDYWPGPLDTINGATDSVTALQYDRIWKVDKNQIAEFNYYFGTGAVQSGAYIPADDIITWPAHGSGNYSRKLAPFVDVNGDGFYDPLGDGDYPKIKGDQMLFWIFNDNLAPHTESGGFPLMAEFHASAYVYACPSVNPSDSVINYTTLYNYKIFNRSTEDYDSVYVGVFEDFDLGYFGDDYVGCYPPGNFGFGYNGDAYDGLWSPTPGIYGTHPPIISTVILNGPPADPNDGIDNDNDGVTDETGEINLMTNFLYYYSDLSGIGNPEYAEDFYGFLHSIWKDSTHVTYGGSGYFGTTPTNFMFPGMPFDTASWNEYSVGNTPYDRRFVMSAGPFSFNSGTSTEFDYAMVWVRDTNFAYNDSNLFLKNIAEVNKVRSWFNNNNAPSCMQWALDAQELEIQKQLSLSPNPASQLLSISFEAESDNAVFDVIDLAGRSVRGGNVQRGGLTAISVEELPAGLYFVRITDGNKVYAEKFIRR